MTHNQKSDNMFSQKSGFDSSEETNLEEINLEETNLSKDLTNETQREPLQVIMIGSPKVVTSIIHYLHAMGYTHATDWTPLERCPSNSEKVMSTVVRKIQVR